MQRATTLEFRAAVRKALDTGGIKVNASYSDKPKKKHQGPHNADIRYVALDIGGALYKEVDPMVEELNKEFERRGLDTRALRISNYIRGVCQAA